MSLYMQALMNVWSENRVDYLYFFLLYTRASVCILYYNLLKLQTYVCMCWYSSTIPGGWNYFDILVLNPVFKANLYRFSPDMILSDVFRSANSVLLYKGLAWKSNIKLMDCPFVHLSTTAQRTTFFVHDRSILLDFINFLALGFSVTLVHEYHLRLHGWQ
jgi:hypothetical protein